MAAVVAVIGMVVVGALAIALTVAAVHDNARINRLRHHGVAVTITVTGCSGQGTGMGATLTTFRCRGTFTLNGHRYTDAIGGSHTRHSIGDKVKGVTDAADPADLSTVEAAEAKRTSATPFIAPGALLVLLLTALVVWRRQGWLALRTSRSRG
jgi:hypothetical protein